MTTTPVCVDGSLILKLTLDEEQAGQVRDLLASWYRECRPLIAPSLLAFETTSVLRVAVRRGRLTHEDAVRALERFLAMSIRLVRSPLLHRRAFALAERFGLSAAYDAHYLAPAEAFECEFWTADQRLYNAVRDRFPLVRVLA